MISLRYNSIYSYNDFLYTKKWLHFFSETPTHYELIAQNSITSRFLQKYFFWRTKKWLYFLKVTSKSYEAIGATTCYSHRILV